MPRYIVFTTGVTIEPAPDPLGVPALITDAPDEQTAIDTVVKTSRLVPGQDGEIHACDLTATQTFLVNVDISSVPKP